MAAERLVISFLAGFEISAGYRLMTGANLTLDWQSSKKYQLYWTMHFYAFKSYGKLVKLLACCYDFYSTIFMLIYEFSSSKALMLWEALLMPYILV